MLDPYSKSIENLRASRIDLVRAIEMLESGHLRSGGQTVNTTSAESLEQMRQSLRRPDSHRRQC
jgi:hypothetical protein